MAELDKQGSGTGRQRLKLLALTLVSTTLSFLVAIAVAGYLTVWPLAMSAEGDSLVLFDPEIGMVAHPNAHTRHVYPAIADRAPFVFDIYTDDRGARVDGPGQRSAAHYDIMTIGDSFTWAYALANQESFASRLGRDLGVSVINFALASYGTTASLQVMKRNLDLKPRLVIYGVIAHHFERNVWPCAPSYYEFCLDMVHVAWGDDGKPYVAPPFSNGVRRMQVHMARDFLDPVSWLTHGIDVVVGRAYEGWTRAHEPDQAKKEEAMLFLLREMNRLAREGGARLLVVFLPTNYYGPPGALPGIVARAGDGIRFLDLTARFERNRREGGPNPYIVGDGHPSAVGHALIADEIAAYVRREGLLGSDASPH